MAVRVPTESRQPDMQSLTKQGHYSTIYLTFPEKYDTLKKEIIVQALDAGMLWKQRIQFFVNIRHFRAKQKGVYHE